MRKKVVAFGVSLGLLTIAGSGAIASTGDKAPELQKPVNIDFSVNYSPYYYKWHEKGGVDEKGWIHSLGAGAKVRLSNIGFLPYFEPSFKIYGGDVNYDGKTWGGSELESRTNFHGWNLELDAGYRLCITRNFDTSIYAGVGYEYWKRSIETTETSIGYDEKWSQKYVKLGVKPQYELGRYYIYGDLYLKYPWDVKNKVSLFDVEVEPEERINYGAELGGGIKGFLGKRADLFASVFYEREKFGKSDLEYSEVAGGEVYQPESKRETYGFKIGIRF